MRSFWFSPLVFSAKGRRRVRLLPTKLPRVLLVNLPFGVDHGIRLSECQGFDHKIHIEFCKADNTK